MRFQLLGPVRGWDGECELDLGSPQQRLTLAALLMAEGRGLTAERLVEILWGEEPPKTSVETVRTYLSRLRTVLGKDVIRSSPGGYACAVPHDLETFSTLTGRAADASPEQARELLARALGLWRGEPLAGLPGTWATGQRVRLTELRLSALGSYAEAGLALGEDQAVVRELTEAVAAHPAQEGLAALLMRALYRSGRQAEAIGVYTGLRTFLAEQFGVGPTPELAALYQRIISGDPALVPPSATPAQRGACPTPRQLPPDLADFTGRREQIETMLRCLSSQAEAATAVLTLSGQGGVGKTALALHVAHAVHDLFPDGQLFVNLRGAGADPVAPEAALGGFLRALGQNDPPSGPGEQSALYRSLLADRRVLVVLDDASDAAQIRPLLPGGKGCAVLVTSRTVLTDVSGACHLHLDPLAPGEALALFTGIVGASRVEPERDSAAEVVTACGYLPLAVRIAAARLTARSAWTVTSLWARLMDHRRRLRELRAGGLDVEAAFDLSYMGLTDDQARAFRLLAGLNIPCFPLETAAAVLGVPGPDAEEILESLVDLNMLTSGELGRYRYHDLLRLYGRQRASPEEAARALTRCLGHLLASATNAAGVLTPGDGPGARPGMFDVPGVVFGSPAEAQAWQRREAAAVAGVLTQAAVQGEAWQIRLASDVAVLLGDLVDSRRLVSEFQSAFTALARAASAAGDRWAEGRARAMLSRMHRGSEADAEVRAAIGLARKVGDVHTLADALAGAAASALVHGRGDEAVGLAGEAAVIARRHGLRSLEADALEILAVAHRRTGALDEALTSASESLRLHRELGNRRGAGVAMRTLGMAYRALGRLAESIDVLDQAVAELDGTHWPEQILLAHLSLAESLRLAGRLAEARGRAGYALRLATEAELDYQRAQCLDVIARVLLDMGEREAADVRAAESLAIKERLGLPTG
ncbi:BTAD domain-containing putative transcriptional regulator [Streptosporangium sp. NPDC001559]|uniref:AfsR/SARP family transcriptional regulator n=1 Tax=Streptosporangium sp. NPDC001559 TaxID=3366187 RepID=UPI0036EAB686